MNNTLHDDFTPKCQDLLEEDDFTPKCQQLGQIKDLLEEEINLVSSTEFWILEVNKENFLSVTATGLLLSLISTLSAL